MLKIEVKKDNGVLWYSLGSLIYSLSYFVLSLVVVRVVGGVEGGAFTYGLSTLGQHIFLLSYFGVRGIHITDTSYRHSFKDYLCHRYITVILSIVVSLLYILIEIILKNGTTNENTNNHYIIILALLGLNILEGLFDIYDCEYQRDGYLNKTGQSIFFRSLIYDISLILILISTKNLVLSVIISLIARIIVEGYFVKNLYKLDIVFNSTTSAYNIKQIFIESFPLALSTFFDFYVFASTKYVVNYMYGDEYNGYYGIIFMPASLIFVFANFIIRPASTVLSEKYNNNDINAYEKTKKNIYLKVSAFCIAILVITVIVGKYALSIVNKLCAYEYNEFFKNGYILLICTVIAGILYALLTIPYYILIIKAKQIQILKVYIIMLFISTFVSIFFIKKHALIGAGFAQIINMFVLLVLLICCEKQDGK